MSEELTPDQINHIRQEKLGKAIHDPETSIVVTCMNGRTRSKAIANILRGMGYTHVGAMGVRDHAMPEKVRKEILRRATLIIPVADDVQSETYKLIENGDEGKLIYPFIISNKDYFTLGEGTPQNKQTTTAQLKVSLTSQGFGNFSKQQESK